LAKIWDHALLLKAIEDEDPAIRKQAVSLLNDHQPEPPEAVEGLLKALQDQDVDVFLYAATVLGQRKETAAVPFLIAALKNEEKRFYAIIALRDLGPGAMEAVPGLIQVLEDEGVIDWQKREAQDTLKEITGQDLGEDPATWKEWWQKQQ
ncbi:MAG TPA: HEAT repeat domain-containing protein, partial [Anaerolineales bacterium]|nr:HEAT repeat domain-containing protein [Anaerolineales bacterium]